jgi:hypothetical protein
MPILLLILFPRLGETMYERLNPAALVAVQLHLPKHIYEYEGSSSNAKALHLWVPLRSQRATTPEFPDV